MSFCNRITTTIISITVRSGRSRARIRRRRGSFLSDSNPLCAGAEQNSHASWTGGRPRTSTSCTSRVYRRSTSAVARSSIAAKRLWCGWALATNDGRRVFFAGDTGYHPEFTRIAERCGPFDLALLPIGAYEPRWFMRYLHMNPEEAVEAFRGLGAQLMVPIHWGTFKLTDEAMDEPPVRARAAFAAANLPMERYRQLAHGETLTI